MKEHGPWVIVYLCKKCNNELNCELYDGYEACLNCGNVVLNSFTEYGVSPYEVTSKRFIIEERPNKKWYDKLFSLFSKPLGYWEYKTDYDSLDSWGETKESCGGNCTCKDKQTDVRPTNNSTVLDHVGGQLKAIVTPRTKPTPPSGRILSEGTYKKSNTYPYRYKEDTITKWPMKGGLND